MKSPIGLTIPAGIDLRAAVLPLPLPLALSSGNVRTTPKRLESPFQQQNPGDNGSHSWQLQQDGITALIAASIFFLRRIAVSQNSNDFVNVLTYR